VLAASLIAALSAAGETPARPIDAGRWGGEHAALDVTGPGAAIQLDCAHGSISAPLVLDEEGGFDLAGTFAKEHGGPIRKDDREHPLPARYRGRVQGGKMTLTIDVAGEGAPVGPLTLERGSEGHVVRCR
jgi:hypothetical protein